MDITVRPWTLEATRKICGDWRHTLILSALSNFPKGYYSKNVAAAVAKFMSRDEADIAEALKYLVDLGIVIEGECGDGTHETGYAINYDD